MPATVSRSGFLTLAVSAAVLLLLAVAWTASCQREGAVDPTAAAPTTATAEAEPGAAEEPARPTPPVASATPSPTSVPTVTPTPSPAAVPRATPTIWDSLPRSQPCGPGVRQVAHRRFLHWANGTSTLIVDVGDAISQVDAGGEWVREVVDLDPQSEHDPEPMLYGRHADISPDGSRIVYSTCEYTNLSVTGDYEIATANPDGTGRQRLTRSTSFENYPVWSPDGTRIAFIASYDSESDSDSGSRGYEPSETRIFTMAPDGTDVKVVPNTEGVGLYPPVWSPDGERLVFAVNEEWASGYREKRILYTVSVDGSELSRIGEASTLPTWSPDSERLAFGFNAQAFGGGEFDPGVHTVRFDGSDARQVMDLRVPQVFWNPNRPNVRHVSWSPDGSELLIASDLLLTVRPDGSDLRAFSQLGLGLIHDATWSPDGSWIAVRQFATQDLYDWAYVVSVMTRNGTDVTILAEGDSDQGSDPFIRQYTPPLSSAACSAGVVVPEPGANPGLVQDCETLVGAVGRLVELPAWEALGWNADTPIAEWSRVTVGGDPLRIRELMLEGSGLTGMPGEFGRLAMLEALYLHGNKMSGAIPPELGKLTMLEHLTLGNNLSRCVPPGLSDLWIEASGFERCEP